ncbi:MAG: hypothetical protein QM755_00035 [Luteolibacter sp.]
MPATAQACAMPLPMVPAPMMPTVWMSIEMLLEGKKKKTVADASRSAWPAAGAAASWDRRGFRRLPS